MARFTADNTEGYSSADLARLNDEFDRRVDELHCEGIDASADDMHSKSLLDHIAERVLADFDVGR